MCKYINIYQSLLNVFDRSRYIQIPDIRIYCTIYIFLLRSRKMETDFHLAFEICARTLTYVRRSRQACVNFRFDEHDLVASRGPFNGISVLRKREILNFKTRIRTALSYSESVGRRRRHRFLAYFWKCDKSAIRETEHKLRRRELSILICNCVNYITEYSGAFARFETSYNFYECLLHLLRIRLFG